MRIRTEDRYGKIREYDSIGTYARNQLDGDDYDSGVLEVAAKTAENNSEAIGRLLELLVTIGIINLNDVMKVVSRYADDKDTIEELI